MTYDGCLVYILNNILVFEDKVVFELRYLLTRMWIYHLLIKYNKNLDRLFINHIFGITTISEFKEETEIEPEYKFWN